MKSRNEIDGSTEKRVPAGSSWEKTSTIDSKGLSRVCIGDVIAPDLVLVDTTREGSDTEAEELSDRQPEGVAVSYQRSSTILPRLVLCLLELTVVVTGLFYLSARLCHRFHDEYLLPQMKLMKWTDERKGRELTYYNRYCDSYDVTASTVEELTIQPNTTAQQCMEHMLTHGVSLYPNVLQNSTADMLRAYISNRTNKRERFNVIENESRYSYSLEVNQDPVVVQAMYEIATHRVVRPALEQIIGPNPAVIEFSDITSTYGSQEQRWHQDVIPAGSAFKYARSFIPSYSLFIPLQDTTTEMGATQVCPGTHVCGPENDFCIESDGFPVSGDVNRWHKGEAALMNQQLQHRGPGHVDPEAPDRVMLVLTLAPRPRFERMELETRILAQGAAYSINWNNWGHTLDDFAHAPTAMRQPWKTLRSLGFYKPRDNVWGWDYFTTTAARIVNEEYYFQKDDLEVFLDNGAFWFLPDFLQGRARPDDDYYDFLLDTFLRTEKFLTKASSRASALYTCGLALVALSWRTQRLSRIYWSVGRVTFPLICLCIFSTLAAMTLQQTSWFGKIHSSKSFTHRRNTGDIDNAQATLPYRNDVLIDTRYNSRYLGSYSGILDATHPGNKRFKAMVSQHSLGYRGLSTALQEQFAATMMKWVAQGSGRLLGQKADGNWKRLADNAGRGACHISLLKASNNVVGMVLTELGYLQAETEFGLLRDTSLHRAHIPALLRSIKGHLAYPRPPHVNLDFSGSRGRSQEETRGHSQLHTSVQTAKTTSRFSPVQMSDTKSISTSTGLTAETNSHVPGIPPEVPIEEPYQGAWLKVGDIVEAKLEGSKNEWYRSTIISANADTGTFDVEHEYNGFVDEGLCRLCVRWYEPPELDDEVRVRVFTRKAYPGRVVAVNDDGTFDIETEKIGVRENVHPMDIRTYDWTWWVGTNVEVQSEHDDFDWEQGLVMAENDGLYSVELQSGHIERQVATERVRPFLP